MGYFIEDVYYGAIRLTVSKCAQNQLKTRGAVKRIDILWLYIYVTQIKNEKLKYLYGTSETGSDPDEDHQTIIIIVKKIKGNINKRQQIKKSNNIPNDYLIK